MNRRQLLVSGGSVLALALTPSVAVAVSPAPFVLPTTNIVHLAGRIGQKCLFNEDDLLRMLGLDPSTIPVPEERPTHMGWYDEPHYDRLDEAGSRAKNGAHDVYERARLVIGIKRKINLHFNFAHYDQIAWLDRPNQHLNGMTFRQTMKADLRLAAEVIDSALQG